MRTHRISIRGRIRAPPLRSADFQVGCIADFQIREPGIVQVALECVADLEIGDTAGFQTCATGAVCGCARLTPRATIFRHSMAEGLHAHCPNSDWRREMRPAMA